MSLIQISVMIGVAVLIVAVFIFWPRVSRYFGDSETFVIARVQMLVGVLMAADLTPIIPGNWTPYYVIVMGVLTELGRRNRTEGFSGQS